MSTYVALLRGVNVSGVVLKMDRVRELWAGLGFKEVRTYLQSGNVIFLAADPPAKWLTAIEKKIADTMGRQVAVIVRTPADLKSVIEKNPYKARTGIEPSRLAVAFLNGIPLKNAAQGLERFCSGGEEFHVAGREIFLYCPNGLGSTKLTNNAIEKALAVKATSRNWNTINKLHELASPETL
ncbi:MAG: DUF1697 domain-containing protein [Terriglobales bacterium]